MDQLGKPTLLAAGIALLLAVDMANAAEASPADTLLGAARVLVGTPAPAVQLETIDGERIDLATLRGDKAVYLKFWATWCGPCRAQMPHFEQTYQAAGDELAVVALNTGFNDHLDDIRAYREELGIHMPIAVDDGMLAEVFALRITPQHIVIGKDGLIKHIGNRADGELDAVLKRERNAPDLAADVTMQTLAASTKLGVGDSLPAVTVNVGNESLSLNGTTPRGTVLVFMTTWCESYLASTRPEQSMTCRNAREQVERLKAQHPDLRWLGVTSGIWTVPQDLTAYSRDNAVTLPLTLDADSALFRRFGVMRVPTIVIADGSGQIVARIDGYDVQLDDILSAL